MPFYDSSRRGGQCHPPRCAESVAGLAVSCPLRLLLVEVRGDAEQGERDFFAAPVRLNYPDDGEPVRARR